MKEIKFPMDIREEFDTSKINTSINSREESSKSDIYSDTPYIPNSDPRSLNVVEKIKEGVPFHAVNDDPVCARSASVMVRKMLAVDYALNPIVPEMSKEEFISAMLAGGDVLLSGNVYLDEQIIIPEGVSVNLNLNTYTLTLNYTENYAIVVKGNLIIDGTGTVNVTGFGISTGYGSNGNLIINNGVYDAESCDYLFGCFGGNITINGGNFLGEYCVVNNFCAYYGVEGKVIVNDGNFSISNPEGYILVCLDKEDAVYAEGIEVRGGTFSVDPVDYRV